MRAENMTVSNSTYDQIRIQPITSGVNGQIDVLKLSNIAQVAAIALDILTR